VVFILEVIYKLWSVKIGESLEHTRRILCTMRDRNQAGWFHDRCWQRGLSQGFSISIGELLGRLRKSLLIWPTLALIHGLL